MGGPPMILRRTLGPTTLPKSLYQEAPRSSPPKGKSPVDPAGLPAPGFHVQDMDHEAGRLVGESQKKVRISTAMVRRSRSPSSPGGAAYV